MQTLGRAPVRSTFSRLSPVLREIRPLNIVHYVPNFRFEDGGVVRAVFDWCNVFSRRGHRMTMLSYDAPDVPQEWLSSTPNETRAVILPPPTMRRTRLNREALRIAEEKIKHADVLHLHAPGLAGKSPARGNRTAGSGALRRHNARHAPMTGR